MRINIVRAEQQIFDLLLANPALLEVRVNRIETILPRCQKLVFTHLCIIANKWKIFKRRKGKNYLPTSSSSPRCCVVGAACLPRVRVDHLPQLAFLFAFLTNHLLSEEKIISYVLRYVL